MTRSESHSEGERLDRLEQLLNGESDSQLPFVTAVVEVFDIKCPEMEIYLTLLECPESTSIELADELDRGYGVINQRLRSLGEKELVTRQRRIDGEAGLTYEYSAKPLDETVDWMTEQLDDWSAEVSDQLTTFREEWPENDGNSPESA